MESGVEVTLVASPSPAAAVAALRGAERVLLGSTAKASGDILTRRIVIEDGAKRAVGFKLSDGMEIPDELGSFKFARQKSKLAGTIRGSYFVIKGED